MCVSVSALRWTAIPSRGYFSPVLSLPCDPEQDKRLEDEWMDGWIQYILKVNIYAISTLFCNIIMISNKKTAYYIFKIYIF